MLPLVWPLALSNTAWIRFATRLLRKSWWPEVGEDHAKRETNAWTGSNATNRSITSPGRTAVIILVLCRAPWMANDELRKSWWPEVESNHRHRDFQSLALPTELSGLVLCSVVPRKQRPCDAILPAILRLDIWHNCYCDRQSIAAYCVLGQKYKVTYRSGYAPLYFWPRPCTQRLLVALATQSCQISRLGRRSPFSASPNELSACTFPNFL